ncbi:hypothetical protein ACFE04_029969 [Oxalis oulophora]
MVTMRYFAAIFLALSMKALLISCSAHTKVVLDNEGKPFLSGYFYYIVPATGGSIGQANSRDTHFNCATSIVQHSESNRGIPVGFTLKSRVLNGAAAVNESTSLFINFQIPNLRCGNAISSGWKVHHAKLEGHYFLSLGGHDLSKEHLFQIVKSTGHYSYKILYCPNGKGCKNVGVVPDADGVHRLGLNDTSLDVLFVRA